MWYGFKVPLIAGHTFRCFGCRFLSGVDIDVSGFDQPVDYSLDCASDTVHRPLAMVGLILVPLQCNISVKLGKQCKYKLVTKLRGATIAPQNHLTRFTHQIFQLADNGGNTAESSDSRVNIWFSDNSHRNFSQIILTTLLVIRARDKHAKVLLTKVGKLYLILLWVAVAFTVVNVN